MKFLDEEYTQLKLFEFEREVLFADIKPGELSYQESAKIRARRNFVRYLLDLQRRRQKEGKDKAVRCKFDERCPRLLDLGRRKFEERRNLGSN